MQKDKSPWCMNSRRAAWVMWLIATGLLPAPAAAEEKKVQTAFDESGLSALTYGGVGLLKTALPGADYVFTEDAGLDEKGFRQYKFEKVEESPKSTFDADNKTLRQQYSWGALAYAYTPKADGLAVTVTVTNTCGKTLADFGLTLMTLKFPAPPERIAGKGAIVSSLDNLAIVEAAFGDDKLIACCETIHPPVHFGLGKPTDKDNREYPLHVRGGVFVSEPGAHFVYPHGLPRVPAGKSLKLDFSLHLAPSAAETDAILADLYARFREFHKPAHVWKDHRPVGALHLPSVGGGKSQTNPRGWFGKADLDPSKPQGKAEFRKLLMKWADQAVVALKDVDAQGMIVWNTEGEENPHPISYIGDPRMLKTLAPEMDEAADEFFQKFRDANFRTGVCIRPTQVYFNQDKKQWAHGTGSDMPGRNEQFQFLRPKDLPAWQFFPIVERMGDKIAYARKRWGCTVFYVDTNGIFQQFGEKGEFKWRLLDCDVWRRLAEKHPDVLLIPELVRDDWTYHAATWAYCAPYMELDFGGVWATPKHVRKLFPQAFSVINMKDAKSLDQRRDDLVAGVRGGDILLFRGWFKDWVNAKVKSIYQDAGNPPATAPAGK